MCSSLFTFCQKKRGGIILYRSSSLFYSHVSLKEQFALDIGKQWWLHHLKLLKLKTKLHWIKHCSWIKKDSYLVFLLNILILGWRRFVFVVDFSFLLKAWNLNRWDCRFSLVRTEVVSYTFFVFRNKKQQY